MVVGVVSGSVMQKSSSCSLEVCRLVSHLSSRSEDERSLMIEFLLCCGSGGEGGDSPSNDNVLTAQYVHPAAYEDELWPFNP